ncbi:unnamed protein product [Rhizophagus irregularis]|nr:unnamed protein product [Rhizophagus irregularis]
MSEDFEKLRMKRKIKSFSEAQNNSEGNQESSEDTQSGEASLQDTNGQQTGGDVIASSITLNEKQTQLEQDKAASNGIHNESITEEKPYCETVKNLDFIGQKNAQIKMRHFRLFQFAKRYLHNYRNFNV